MFEKRMSGVRFRGLKSLYPTDFEPQDPKVVEFGVASRSALSLYLLGDGDKRRRQRLSAGRRHPHTA